MSSTDDGSPPRVLIVGAGFAGIACARDLGHAGVDVTLVDRHTYHEFQPLLYQVATAQLAPGDIMAPLRGLFRKQTSVDVKAAEVVQVDLATRTVTTTEGPSLTGDHLVLSLGAEPNFFGVPGAEEHAFPLYSTDDARHLRNRVLQMFEDADLDPSRIERGALNVVIVGAGPTGVETAGALADLVHDAMPQRYHDLAVSRARVYLVDHGHAVLSPFSEKAQKYAADQLTAKGVHLKMGMSVTEVGEDEVVFADGSAIATRCVVWAGGLKARTLPGLETLPTSRGGRITVQPDLSVDGHPGVYALGDCAAKPSSDGAVLPQLGSVAKQTGSAAAASILASIAGDVPRPFHYHDKGIMAMIGRRAAIAEVGSHHHELHGPIAFSAWLGVHAWLMSTSRERIDAFMSWAWDSFSKSRTPAVIVDPDATRIDWGDARPEDPTPTEMEGPAT